MRYIEIIEVITILSKNDDQKSARNFKRNEYTVIY